MLIASMCEKDRTGGCREDTTEWLNNNKDKAGKRRVSMCREPPVYGQGAVPKLLSQKLKDLILTVYLLRARPSPWGSFNSPVHPESGVLLLPSRKRKLRERGKIHTRTHDQ